ncbi:TetR/AcrR family transcriptional regulator [Paenibacillus sp. CC-CFT742]|nr:TetR family transcriptional regulator [Paenibacillus sp. CC-CFT742]WJH31593.1 TetR/AcrR family transcriptional regulator [Paenibacillus sp. CC-CFT742]
MRSSGCALPGAPVSPRQGLDRGTLLSAAAQLADSDGFQALTLAALAQRLDVRSPSLYNHISGLPGFARNWR